MTTWNKAMTIEEATKLFNCKDGMTFPNTPHNRKLMAKITKDFLISLREA